MENGFVVIKNDSTNEKAAGWTENIWVRLVLDPNDKNNRDRERMHTPWRKRKLENVAMPQRYVQRTWG
ncbi:hypothetical protein OG21DRAFT_1512451 [Imleria badia]|nr:hypothetical protein OG21DRAFT_1512451 [Imleria badia]